MLKEVKIFCRAFNRIRKPGGNCVVFVIEQKGFGIAKPLLFLLLAAEQIATIFYP